MEERSSVKQLVPRYHETSLALEHVEEGGAEMLSTVLILHKKPEAEKLKVELWYGDRFICTGRCPPEWSLLLYRDIEI